MLEEELRKLHGKAEKIAKQFAASVGQSGKAGSLAQPATPKPKGDDYQQVSLRIDNDCYLIAKTLAFEAGSVPKVCEPILERLLEGRQIEATRAAQELVRKLTRPKKTSRRPKKEPERI